MRNPFAPTVFAALLVLAGCTSSAGSEPQAQRPAPPSAAPTAANYKDISVEVEGQTVTLVDGVAETAAAPGSAAKVATRYFGNDATGDLNGDGAPDVAFLITQSRGGSGTFFYVVAALKTPLGYAGTNGVLLGDRIAPRSTQINAGELVANYADRKPGDPMTTSPSVGVSKYLKVVSGKLQVSR